MFYFVVPWILLIIGITANALLDRHPARRSAPRLVEIALLWVVVGLAAWGLIGVLGHIGPNSEQMAVSIGYTPSMFQWEVGFGDLALSTLGIVAFWWRDRWMTAAVVALAISYWGDALGHVMQYVGDGNDAPNNVWAIPSDIVQPLLGIVLLVLYRRGLGKLPTGYRHGVAGGTNQDAPSVR